jgi:hypothetical protein
VVAVSLKKKKIEKLENIKKKKKKKKNFQNLVDSLKCFVLNYDFYKIRCLNLYYLRNFIDCKEQFLHFHFLDIALQNLYSFIFFPFLESNLDKFTYGPRVFRSSIDAVKVLFLLGKQKKYSNYNKYLFCFAFNYTIVKCFDAVFNSWVLSNVSFIDKSILSFWVKNGFDNFYSGDQFFFQKKNFEINWGTSLIFLVIFNFVFVGMQFFLESSILSKLGFFSKFVLITDLNSVVILSSDLKTAKIVKSSLLIFFHSRGICQSFRDNSIVDFFCKNCENKNFVFCGITFHYKLIHGKYKFVLSPILEKIKNVKKKVLNLCKKFSKPLVLFDNIKPLMKSWFNSYKIIKNNYSFLKLSYWILGKITKSIYLLYVNSNFERGKFGIRKGRRSGRLYKNIAAQVVKRLYFLKDQQRFFINIIEGKIIFKGFSVGLSKKNSIELKNFFSNSLKGKKFFATFGKNFFNCFDYYDLRTLIFQDKSFAREYFFRKCKGFCPLCKRDFLLCNFKFYYVVPINLNYLKKIFNVIPLCFCCYKIVFMIMKINNVRSLEKFIRLSLLKLN